MSVQDDIVVRVTDLGRGENVTNDTYYNTIDDWFVWLGSAANQDPEIPETEYNSKYGFPSMLKYDQSFRIAGEELQWKLDNFKRSR